MRGGVRNTVQAMMDSVPLPTPDAVLFDAYGTLFDVYSVGLAAEQLWPGRGDALALLWRDKQIDYTRLCSMSGRYRPFWDLTRAGLRFAAQKLGSAAGPRRRGPADERVPAPVGLPREPRGAAGAGPARRARRHPEQRRPRDAGRGGEAAPACRTC
jgi:hypothetical protein